MKLISVIVISYNRPADLLDLLHNLVALDNAANLVEEVIVLNNASSVDYSMVEDFCHRPHACTIRYIKADKNLGVARGRNYAIKNSKAPILLLLDDDALLQNKDALAQVAHRFGADKNENIGAMACKVLYYETLEMQQNAFPHKDFGTLKNEPFFETYYFTGCVHALRRSALLKTGLYPEDFFYGMEEYDLGYRLIGAGYKIVYDASVVLLHKESPLGRNPKAEKLRMMWVNKSKVAWRYLPLKYFFTTALFWSFYFLPRSSWSLLQWLKGWSEIVLIPFREQRKALASSTTRYLQTLNARLWY